MAERFLTKEDAAQIAGKSVRTIERWITDGSLLAVPTSDGKGGTFPLISSTNLMERLGRWNEADAPRHATTTDDDMPRQPTTDAIVVDNSPARVILADMWAQVREIEREHREAMQEMAEKMAQAEGRARAAETKVEGLEGELERVKKEKAAQSAAPTPQQEEMRPSFLRRLFG